MLDFVDFKPTKYSSNDKLYKIDSGVIDKNDF